MPENRDPANHRGRFATEPGDRPLTHSEAPERDAVRYNVVDPDVDLHDPAQRGETTPREWDILAAAAAGGVIGAEARYGVGLALPHSSAQFPWSTVIINASGCALIAVVMVVLLELTKPHRLVRPFLGVGILGGYTTFSTFAVDTERLIVAQQPVTALAYVVVTLVTCAAGVYLAAMVTKRIGEVIIVARIRRLRAVVRSRR